MKLVFMLFRISNMDSPVWLSTHYSLADAEAEFNSQAESCELDDGEFLAVISAYLPV